MEEKKKYRYDNSAFNKLFFVRFIINNTKYTMNRELLPAMQRLTEKLQNTQIVGKLLPTYISTWKTTRRRLVYALCWPLAGGPTKSHPADFILKQIINSDGFAPRVGLLLLIFNLCPLYYNIYIYIFQYAHDIYTRGILHAAILHFLCCLLLVNLEYIFILFFNIEKSNYYA